MKKTLLMAGAAMLIAGNALAAEEGGLKLGVEGYASVYGVYADQDADLAEFGIRKEIQLDFTGEVALENGLTVGVTVETQRTETTGDPKSRGDVESYIYAEGGFGKVIAGAEYNAAYLMQVAAPAVDAEFDGMDPTYNVLNVGDGILLDNDVKNSASAMYGDGDNQYAGADKITYISPINDGLQIGLSYTPQTTDEGSTGPLELPEQQEAYSVAARFDAGEILGAEWTLGAGYNTFSELDTDEWNVGLNAEAGAFNYGVAYYENEENAVKALDAGINYETGAFTYGLSFLTKDVNDDNLRRYMTGVNYAYGPGMSLNGSVSLNDLSSDAGNYEADSTVFAIGTVINF